MQRTWWCSVAAMMVATAVGCSSGWDDRGFHSARVEPELVARAGRSPVAGLVPVVIAGPRAFSRDTPRPVAHRGEPRRLAVGGGAPIASAAAETEIAGMLATYLDDFNRHDVAAVAAHWSEDGENVDLVTGDVTRGRDAVEGVFSALFADDPDAAMKLEVEAIHPVRHDVAVVDGTTTVDFGDGDRAGSRFSAVVVRKEGRWVLETVRESARADLDATERPLDQLEWLVGTWQDLGPGIAATTTCFWSAGRGFLIRSHTVAEDRDEPRQVSAEEGIPGLLPADDAVSREVTEIIGWDPEARLVRSWLFTSEGRFAEGTWTRDGKAWRVRVEGRGGDAGRFSECTVSRLNAGEIAVRGESSGFAEALVPVCDFIRVGQ